MRRVSHARARLMLFPIGSLLQVLDWALDAGLGVYGWDRECRSREAAFL